MTPPSSSEDREAPAEITEVVEAVFCRAGHSRYGPYELRNRGTVVVPGLLFAYRAKDADGRSVGLQVFSGLTGSTARTPQPRLAGSLWEQEVRLLLRLSARRHPAMPAVLGGGYYEKSDLAWVATRTAGTSLDRLPSAVEHLRSNPADAIRHLSQLADGLALLHGQGLIHRNVQPATVDASRGPTEAQSVQLRLTRFEMSAVIANLLRPGGDPETRAAAIRGFFLSQGAQGLAYVAPERLRMLIGSDEAEDRAESPTADVFSLGVMAWEWFVGDLPAFELPDGRFDEPDDVVPLLELHEGLRVGLRSAGLPPRMRDLLLGMLSKASNARLTSTEVVHELTQSYDALSTMWQHRESTQPLLVMFMPDRSQATIHAWKWAVHDPKSDVGLRELRQLIEEDLRGAQFVYSPEGAVPFVRTGDRQDRAKARWVLLGRRAAWFCQVFERRRLFGESVEQLDEILLIKYVARIHDAAELQSQPFRRRVPAVDAVSFELADHDEALDDERVNRPSWRPLMQAVRIETPPSEDQAVFRAAVDWLLDLQDVELRAREYAYVRETPAGAPRAVLRYDRERDVRRIAEHRSGLFAVIAADRPAFSDFIESDDAMADGWLELRADLDGRPDRQTRFSALQVRQLGNDPERVEVEPSQANRAPLPDIGWIRPGGDGASEADLRRQRDAAVELRQAEGLVDQLIKPLAIPGLGTRWRAAGAGLRGGADKVVRRMLTMQPLFALHGPPGTGKTTVVARAVEAYLKAEPGDRLLISAQANDALDHLAEEVEERLSKAGLTEVLSIRLGAPRRDEDSPPAVRKLQLPTQTAALQRRVKARLTERITRGRDADDVRALAGEWREQIERTSLELEDRLRRGANIVYATCSGSNRRTLGASSAFDVFDWVIVEEAAKAWPSELAIPLVRGVRWTLIGDHHQLPAYRRAEVQRTLDGLKDHPREELRATGESAADYKRIFGLFGNLFTAPSGSDAEPVGELTRQFRMREPIAEVVSRAFYRGTLETDPSTDVPSGLRAPRFLADASLVWIDTSGRADCTDEPRWRNTGEAALIGQLLEGMQPFPTPGKDGFSKEPLAILTPWRAQRTCLQATLPDRARDFVHTVDSFQGREADIVVVSLVRERRRGDKASHNLGHVAVPERVNVMLSRARRLLVIVGAFDHFSASGAEFWTSICNTVSDIGIRVPADDGL